jgi:hypothetical protein
MQAMVTGVFRSLGGGSVSSGPRPYPPGGRIGLPGGRRAARFIGAGPQETGGQDLAGPRGA